MKKKQNDPIKNSRLRFIKQVSLAGMGIGLTSLFSPLYGKERTDPGPHHVEKGKKIGIIGLDTSHSIEFTKMLNAPDASPEFGGFKVVAAYPKGSIDIKSSAERIPAYTTEIKTFGVEITSSIEELLSKVDFVMLETNDGRVHLEQALPVIQAGKPLFIDKPMAASLKDAIAIFEAADKHGVPVFSSSSLRYMESAQQIVQGKIGKVLGADVYSPAKLEKTHPDLFWYGIHGVELLYTLMGTGCSSVVRIHTEDTDIVAGTWSDGRIGTVRGTRSGVYDYGGTVYGEKENGKVGPYDGYRALLVKIIGFFRTGAAPVSPQETLELLAFMEAADTSKKMGSIPVKLSELPLIRQH
ncbi:Gfo/Idh/MocA family protein [Flavitalea flava]